MMKRSFLALVFVLAGLSAFTVPMVGAIGEVTPTPVPNSAPAVTPTLIPAPTALPTVAPSQPLNPPSGDVEALLDAALEQLTAGDYQGAVDTLTQALQLEPDNAQAYLLRGASYTQLNNYTQAVADYTQAIELVPYAWSYYVFRADAYIELGDNAEALLDYEKAMELNPRYTEAFQGRSLLLMNMNSRQEAQIDDLIAQGLSRSEFGDFEGAIDFYTQAIDADTQSTRASAYAYYNRALTWFQSGDVTTSIEDYTSALEFYPEMHDAYLGRGIAYAQQDDTRMAGGDFQRRIEILEQRSFNQTLDVGDNVEVEMAYGTVYRVTFTGLGGDSLAIEARDREGVGVDPLIVLLDPSGVPLAGDDDFGGGLDALIESVRLPADGTYTILVSHANGGFDGTVRIAIQRSVNA